MRFLKTWKSSSKRSFKNLHQARRKPQFGWLNPRWPIRTNPHLNVSPSSSILQTSKNYLESTSGQRNFTRNIEEKISSRSGIFTKRERTACFLFQLLQAQRKI